MSTWQAGTMRARRGLTTIAMGGLAAGLLSGCVPNDGRNYSNATDVARSQRAWSDPWLATEGPSVAGPSASGSTITRDVAGRGYQTHVAPLAIVTTEVRAALATGWRLVGAQCERNEQGILIDVSAQLARGSHLDDWTLAKVKGSPRNGETPTTSSGSPDTYTQVTVGASVPHHLDTTWPDPPALELSTSCLVQDPTTTSATPGPSSTPPVEPTTGRLPGDRTDPPEWSSEADGDLRAAVDATASDPGLKSLGLSVAMPASSEGSEARDAAKASAGDIDAAGGLVGSVRSLTSQGWTVTYAACIGPGAPNIAELSRPAGKRTAVLRLSQVPSAAGDSPVDATVVVSTPGYGPAIPPAVTDLCFADTTPPTAFSHRGIPSQSPMRMFPLQS